MFVLRTSLISYNLNRIGQMEKCIKLDFPIFKHNLLAASQSETLFNSVLSMFSVSGFVLSE